MKYKLIALDLDGTLFNDEHCISSVSEEYIRKLVKEGFVVVISTGRSYSSLKPRIAALELESPVICYNGAMIRNGKTDDILANSTVPEDISRELITLSRSRGIHFHGFLDGDFNYERESSDSQFYRNLSGLKGRIVDFDIMESIDFTKCMFINENSILLDIEKELRAAYGDRCYIAFSKPNFLEIMNSTASKANALEVVARDLGIARDEIIAFGDGLNDMEMLEFAGRGIAMINGHEDLKADLK